MLAAAGLVARSSLLGQSSNPAAAPAAPATPAAPAAGFTAFRPLRRNVGVFTGRGGTIAWLAGKDALAVVDTQFPDTAALCIAGLPGRGDRQIDVVLNTHHHADHTGGNRAFKAVSRTIVAHKNVPKLQFEAAQRAEKDQKAGSTNRLEQQVYADTTFGDFWRRDLGDEVVSAQYHGAAHTSGDAIVMFEKANVVHMGDLVFNRMYPVIDPAAGASARHWITVLEEAVRTYPADAIYVFGHGNAKFDIVGKRDDLLVMRDYWTAVLAHVEKEIAAGKSRADIIALPALPGFTDFDGARRFGTNLAAAYDELTKKS
ncbi:MBL fold metallo-hydrolase [Opitutus sp. ER46]|uniref:MBL fold metallo-hydrolase n=1 Tax=Opitutus sp. ER46 TaxID=2161864 RepID=UPI001E502EE7|nr:MBL fold metallo-hydrolase [Opitutus sp. ER46]